VSSYLCDTSVWIALSIQAHIHNHLAARWFDTITEHGAVLFCRATEQSVLRLLTTTSVMVRYGISPLSNEAAWGIIDSLFDDDRVSRRLNEPPGIDRYWRQFSARRTSSPNVWMDAYLAAFARAADCQLVTIDGGFSQYRGLDALVLVEETTT
jgi:toxin-antitoxin system PIN domain toxin